MLLEMSLAVFSGWMVGKGTAAARGGRRALGSWNTQIHARDRPRYPGLGDGQTFTWTPPG